LRALVVGQFKIRPSRRMDSIARKEQPFAVVALTRGEGQCKK
jgi:hypothetical protein